jgi:hypothetical protein
LINLLRIPRLRIPPLGILLLIPRLNRLHHLHRTGINIHRPGLSNLRGINLLGLNNEHRIRKRFLALPTRELVRENLYFDAEDTLSQENVAGSGVDEVADLAVRVGRWVGEHRLTRVDHESVGKFHGFGSCGTKFPRNNDLTPLRPRLHNKSQHTIASTTISPQPTSDVPSHSQPGK